MGSVGGTIAGAILGATSLLGLDESRRASREQAAAQEKALAAQTKAQEAQLALQQKQAKRTAALQEQQRNQAQKDIASAAAAMVNTPPVTNPANLTGGQGVSPDSLTLGGSATLGESSLDSLLGEYI